MGRESGLDGALPPALPRLRGRIEQPPCHRLPVQRLVLRHLHVLPLPGTVPQIQGEPPDRGTAADLLPALITIGQGFLPRVDPAFVPRPFVPHLGGHVGPLGVVIEERPHLGRVKPDHDIRGPLFGAEQRPRQPPLHVPPPRLDGVLVDAPPCLAHLRPGGVPEPHEPPKHHGRHAEHRPHHGLDPVQRRIGEDVGQVRGNTGEPGPAQSHERRTGIAWPTMPALDPGDVLLKLILGRLPLLGRADDPPGEESLSGEVANRPVDLVTQVETR